MKIFVNARYEAIALIKILLTGIDGQTEIVKDYREYGVKEEEITELFKKYHLFIQAIKDDIKGVTINKELEKYYAKITDDRCFIMHFMVRYEKMKDKMPLIEIINTYYHRLIELLLEETESNNCSSYIINQINRFEIPSDVKLVMIDFYVNHEKIINDFNNLIDEITPFIEKYYYLVEDDCKETLDIALTSSFIEDKLSFKIRIEDKVYVSILVYNDLTINLNDGDECIYYIGIMFFKLYNLKTNNVGFEEKLATRLKVMSDSTRFQIIKLLLNKEMYSQELAKTLDLTSATLSHHINQLIYNDLIVYKRIEKKKFYYNVNKEAIKEIARYLERMISDE